MVTEYEFQLPVGFIDETGATQRYGRLRLSAAADEMDALEKTRDTPAYLPVYLLSRVITQLGNWQSVTPDVLEQLYAADIAYLSELYTRINGTGALQVTTVCPHCQNPFQLEVEM